MHVRKARAGSTSHGHVWHRDGQVLEIPDAHGYELVRIPDGGFVEVNPGVDEDEPVEEPSPEPDVTEPAPPDPQAIDEAPRPRRGRPPRADTEEG